MKPLKPFQYEVKFQEKIRERDPHIKELWEENNDDDRTFVSTMREMNNEVLDYWKVRKQLTQEKQAAPTNELLQEPAIRQVLDNIEKSEQKNTVKPHHIDTVKKLFSSRTVEKESITHSSHVWNEKYDKAIQNLDWSTHFVRDFNSSYGEDKIKYKHTMRS